MTALSGEPAHRGDGKSQEAARRWGPGRHLSERSLLASPSPRNTRVRAPSAHRARHLLPNAEEPVRKGLAVDTAVMALRLPRWRPASPRLQLQSRPDGAEGGQGCGHGQRDTCRPRSPLRQGSYSSWSCLRKTVKYYRQITIYPLVTFKESWKCIRNNKQVPKRILLLSLNSTD